MCRLCLMSDLQVGWGLSLSRRTYSSEPRGGAISSSTAVGTSSYSSTHRSPLSLFPKSQFFYCKVSRLNLFFSQLEVNDAHKPNFFLLGVLQYGGPYDASGEYPEISLKRMTQMTCCLFEHPLCDQRPGHGT